MTSGTPRTSDAHSLAAHEKPGLSCLSTRTAVRNLGFVATPTDPSSDEHLRRAPETQPVTLALLPAEALLPSVWATTTPSIAPSTRATGHRHLGHAALTGRGVRVPPRLDSSLYPLTVSPAELNAAEPPLPPLSSISNRWASCS